MTGEKDHWVVCADHASGPCTEGDASRGLAAIEHCQTLPDSDTCRLPHCVMTSTAEPGPDARRAALVAALQQVSFVFRGRHGGADKPSGGGSHALAVTRLLNRAAGLLDEAAAADGPRQRYVLAHTAALYAASAVAAGGDVRRAAEEGETVWELAARTWPAIADQTLALAAASGKRAAAEAGLPYAATGPEADALLQQAMGFLACVTGRTARP